MVIVDISQYGDWTVFVKNGVAKLLEIDLLVSAPWPILSILMIYALFKEWWLHVAKLDISDLFLVVADGVVGVDKGP